MSRATPTACPPSTGIHEPAFAHQLAGFGGLLGDPNHSATGTCYYIGTRYDPTPEWGFGLEFNHGSPIGTPTPRPPGNPTRSSEPRGCLEGYVVWNFAHGVFLKAGYIDYLYSTAFSGWHIQPGPSSSYNLNNNPVLQYASPSSVKDFYISLEARF